MQPQQTGVLRQRSPSDSQSHSHPHAQAEPDTNPPPPSYEIHAPQQQQQQQHGQSSHQLNTTLPSSSEMPHLPLSSSSPSSAIFGPTHTFWINEHSMFTKEIPITDLTSEVRMPYRALNEEYKAHVRAVVKDSVKDPVWTVKRNNWLGLRWKVIERAGTGDGGDGGGGGRRRRERNARVPPSRLEEQDAALPEYGDEAADDRRGRARNNGDTRNAGEQQVLATWHHPFTATGTATLVFPSSSPHCDHAITLKNRVWGMRTESFVYNSAEYCWEADGLLSSHSLTLYKIVEQGGGNGLSGEGGEREREGRGRGRRRGREGRGRLAGPSAVWEWMERRRDSKVVVAKYAQKWWSGLVMVTGGVVVVDAREVDVLVACLTLLVVLKKQRQRRRERNRGAGGGP